MFQTARRDVEIKCDLHYSTKCRGRQSLSMSELGPIIRNVLNIVIQAVTVNPSVRMKI